MPKFCSSPFTTININDSGSVSSCLCAGWHTYGINMGNLTQNSLVEIFDNSNFNTFRQSIVDQSFRYCRKDECAKLWNLDQVDDLSKVSQLSQLPTFVLLHIDRNCNLKCASCRNSLDWSKQANPHAEQILNTLIKDYQNFTTPVTVQCDGMGDIFASTAYQNFFKSDKLPKCFQFNLTTNGNLVTKNLDLIEKIKSQIFSICISFDAANSVTYKEIRGGKFDLIVDGARALIDMGILRVNGMFIVQKKNYKEILDYYYLCKELNLNHAGLYKLDRWPHMSDSWWQDNQIDDNPEVDYDWLIDTLIRIKQDPKFGLCGGLEYLINQHKLN